MKLLLIPLFSLAICFPTFGQYVGLDPSFGSNGISIADFENIVENSFLLGQQTDGKLMVGGYYDIPFFGGKDTFLVARLHENGGLDTTYGTAGLANFREVGWSTGMAVQADNKTIIVGGPNADEDYFRAIRLDEEGNLDSSFGNNGTVALDFGNQLAICEDILLLPDGKILMVGRFSEDINNYWPVLVQLLADGSLDPDFGDNGVVYYQEAPFTRSYINDAQIQPDGKILLAGGREAFSSGPRGWTMWRFLPNGTIDTAYGDEGSVSTVMGTQNGFDEEITQIAIQADGAVIVGGYFPTGPLSRGAILTRYHDDGTLDLDFGDEGIFTPPFSDIAAWGLGRVIIQPDQKILIAGLGSLEGDETAGTKNLQFSRFLPDGTPDLDFDDNGLYTAAAVDFIYSISAMILVEEDRIVVAGRAFPVNDNIRSKIFAARLYYGPEIVAVSEPDTKEEWRLASNPCRDILRIFSVNTETTASPIVRLRLFNLKGQLVLTASGPYLTEVSIGYLSAGSYWLEMTDKDGRVFREKIVKMD